NCCSALTPKDSRHHTPGHLRPGVVVQRLWIVLARRGRLTGGAAMGPGAEKVSLSGARPDPTRRSTIQPWIASSTLAVAVCMLNLASLSPCTVQMWAKAAENDRPDFLNVPE